MATYTNVVSTLAIRIADPLVTLRWLPKVLLLEETEGKIYEGENLEDGGDHECLKVDDDPGGWNLRGNLVEKTDVQESRGWAGEFKLNVSQEFGLKVEDIKGVNVGVDAKVQGDQEINFSGETDINTQDQIDCSEGPWFGAEVLLVNDWVAGAITLHLPCSAVQYIPSELGRGKQTWLRVAWLPGRCALLKLGDRLGSRRSEGRGDRDQGNSTVDEALHDCRRDKLTNLMIVGRGGGVTVAGNDAA